MAATNSFAQPLEPVPFVDLTKYAGKWFEIASFTQRFQKGCNYTTVEYTISDRGYVIIENRCIKDKNNGKTSYIKGKAFVVASSGNAKLQVQFFWPFRGDYWVIDLDENYSYAVVGHPNKKYLWILSRTPTMDNSTYQRILTSLGEKGFEISKLKITKQ